MVVKIPASFLTTFCKPLLSLAHLKQSRVLFNNSVHIVSKAGNKTQQRTAQWLDHNCFWDITAMNPANVHFCTERPQKAPICTSLGVTCFIDDRLDVLQCLHDVQLKLLFPSARKYNNDASVCKVSGWDEIVAILKGEVKPEPSKQTKKKGKPKKALQSGPGPARKPQPQPNKL
eukprot:TRINITY_DN54201_c0_g1_i1.p1 TRINITY_DN54201_c0_g1~~TRINITY_DN54201_c0_g1_i1.p1  ORF type:complete len:174 (-),score=18.83 TRINITY_DN54201_c0_g1_i1:49-570(-)